jgi:hypothetical protein
MSLPVPGRPFRALGSTIESIIGIKTPRGVNFPPPIGQKIESIGGDLRNIIGINVNLLFGV